MQGWLTDSSPIVLLAHSFGTLVAYECAHHLSSVHNYAIQHIISLAGVSFEYLATLPIYQGDSDPVNDPVGFEERFQSEAVSMFGEVPHFVRQGHPSFNAAMKAYTVQGT